MQRRALRRNRTALRPHPQKLAAQLPSKPKVIKLFSLTVHSYYFLRLLKETLCVVSKIYALGFDEKFIRTWEYYFDYCAAGFKYCVIGNYQVSCIAFLLNTFFSVTD